jgi:excisionase family DNA binding protein
VPDVAQLLGVGTNTVYQMLRSGQIPARKAGDKWIISRRRFHDWLDGDGQVPAANLGSAR